VIFYFVPIAVKLGKWLASATNDDGDKQTEHCDKRY